MPSRTSLYATRTHGTIEVKVEKKKGSRFTLTFEWPIAEAIAETVVHDNEALGEPSGFWLWRQPIKSHGGKALP